MRFDFSHIAAPFRMRPGLARLPDGAAQLTALVPGTALHADKQAVWTAQQSRHALAGFDAAPALDAIAAHARHCGIDPAGAPPELAFEEDLAVLDGASGTLPWLCVCVPSHWAPEDKLGLDFSTLHGPVADNAALLAAARPLVRLATAGSSWERWVWTVTPSPAYDQHPRRRARVAWPVASQPAEFADGCYLRAERQTFLPIGRGTLQAVFTIRVGVEPLPQAVRTPADAQRLRDALASMSTAVLDYKGLTAARDPLLRWLDTRI